MLDFHVIIGTWILQRLRPSLETQGVSQTKLSPLPLPGRATLSVVPLTDEYTLHLGVALGQTFQSAAERVAVGRKTGVVW